MEIEVELVFFENRFGLVERVEVGGGRSRVGFRLFWKVVLLWVYLSVGERFRVGWVLVIRFFGYSFGWF